MFIKQSGRVICPASAHAPETGHFRELTRKYVDYVKYTILLNLAAQSELEKFLERRVRASLISATSSSHSAWPIV